MPGEKFFLYIYYRICYCVIALQLIFAKLKDQIGIGYNVICLDIFKKESIVILFIYWQNVRVFTFQVIAMTEESWISSPLS